ncbi:MAG: GntR family transcriptional regulator [Verrucomicrobia bacterium]|nr:GntR family transcriptional regulator [Verrucomicrobiota bacterium]
MLPIPRLALPAPVAEHLRVGIHEGRWSDRLPGVPRMAEELDVARYTVRRALQLLEAEGVLSGRGLGRSRGFAVGSGSGAFRRPLRMAILRHEPRLTDSPHTSPCFVIRHPPR